MVRGGEVEAKGSIRKWKSSSWEVMVALSTVGVVEMDKKVLEIIWRRSGHNMVTGL